MENSILDSLISGGQTGADMAGLLAGEALGIPTKGFAPKGFLIEGGTNPGLVKYGIKEAQTTSWDKRDVLNVDMSDGLVAFLRKVPETGRGTIKTTNYAFKGRQIEGFDDWPVEDELECQIANRENRPRKPIMVIWNLSSEKIPTLAPRLREFVTHNEIRNLMVSGPCQSTFLATLDVEGDVKNLLVAALQ